MATISSHLGAALFNVMTTSTLTFASAAYSLHSVPVLASTAHPSSTDLLQPFQPVVAAPQGIKLVQGGTRDRDIDLSYRPPPAIPLNTEDTGEILKLLEYADIYYTAHESDAAKLGIEIFKIGREFTYRVTFDQITFDWDHTISNYQIFADLIGLIRTKFRKKVPNKNLAQKPLIALESPRPFMQELVLGMMVGYALRQGLKQFDQWKEYKPQVGLATHTWPDRIGVLARWFVRLIPLMAGFLPGEKGIYERVTDPTENSFIHLHDFLEYADDLMKRYDEGGFKALKPWERKEALAYFEDGKAHYRKPLGAFARKGWGPLVQKSLLHFEDSTQIVRDLNENLHHDVRVEALLVQNSHSKPDKDVSELHKISLPALWRSHDAAVAGVAQTLARREWQGSTVPAILSALKLFSSEEDSEPSMIQRTHIPEGIILMLHETPSTLGEFWESYVRRTNDSKKRIRSIRKERGGIKVIRREYEEVNQ